MRVKYCYLICLGALIFQEVDLNCLKERPKLTDGSFNIFNNPIKLWTIKKEDMTELTALFASRFKRAHVNYSLPENYVKDLADAVAEFKMSSKSDIQLVFYTRTPRNKSDPVQAKKMFVETYKAVLQVNYVYPDLVYGLVVSPLSSWDLTFDVMNEALEDLREHTKAKFLLGGHLLDCEVSFRIPTSVSRLQSMKFLYCDLIIPDLETPELQANQVLNSCNNLLHAARIVNITSDIMCIVSYGSNGLMSGGIPGSLNSFSRFWCHLFKEISKKSNQTTVVFDSAFDYPPLHFGEKDNSKILFDSKYHTGWWRRMDKISNRASAFVEKVNYNLEQTSANVANTTYYLVGLILMGVVNLIFLGYLFWTRKIPVTKPFLSKEAVNLFENGVNSSQIDEGHEGQLAAYDKSYEIRRSLFDVDFHTILGKGEHGLIYKGNLHPIKSEIAVKTCRETENSIIQLLSEIKILIYVGKHPNVLSLLGANTSDFRQGNVYVLLEYCEHGSLQHVLRNCEIFSSLQQIVDGHMTETTGHTSSFRIADKWALEIAAGMLHISQKKIIHADLAARNVLIDSQGTAKITDFGLSRKMYLYTQYVKTHREPLPWRWMAPESIKSMIFSTETDVWAYGITLFEIYSKGKLPYPGMGWDISFLELLESGMINTQPKFSDIHRYEIMKKCWNLNPKDRPTFDQLQKSLRSI